MATPARAPPPAAPWACATPPSTCCPGRCCRCCASWRRCAATASGAGEHEGWGARRHFAVRFSLHGQNPPASRSVGPPAPLPAAWASAATPTPPAPCKSSRRGPGSGDGRRNALQLLRACRVGAGRGDVWVPTCPPRPSLQVVASDGSSVTGIQATDKEEMAYWRALGAAGKTAGMGGRRTRQLQLGARLCDACWAPRIPAEPRGPCQPVLPSRGLLAPGLQGRLHPEDGGG